MSQPKEGSPLVQAVAAFDAELEKFAKAATSACRRSLDSKRELDKAADSVREAAEAEQAMQVCAQNLLEKLKEAEADQQSRAQALRARTDEIQARFDKYETFAARYRQLGADGAALVEEASKLRAETRPDQSAPSKTEMVDGLTLLEQKVAALRESARSLFTDSQAEKFDDIAHEAHAVEQTLSALRNKLLLAQKAATSWTPGTS